MLTEGVTFPEAVERLAQMAGVALPKVSHEDQVRDQRRKTLYDSWTSPPSSSRRLWRPAPAPRARGYLADRALNPATLIKFRLGYATSERFALKEHLGSHGIPVEDMIEAGS